MTNGDFVIRTQFTSSNPHVEQFKKLYAELYNQVSAICTWGDGANVSKESLESTRLVKEALQNLETSAMYAVKALTV